VESRGSIVSGRARFALLLLVVVAKLAGCAALNAPARPVAPYPGALCVLDGAAPVRVVRDMAGQAAGRSGWWVVENIDGRGWWIASGGQLAGCL
jgi:hypothetical protein